ncbi:MAG: hypothetical protein LBF79_05920 [Dysgonamonadaceae bacterium]|jgi:hypothetical protein|nr:hypothetical protein [Dysgonamonadaceae bacterium]
METIGIRTSTIGIIPIELNPMYLLSRLSDSDRYLPIIMRMPVARQCEWLSVRLLVQEMLGVGKDIHYHSNGKPYLTGCPYHIGISHTKTHAVIIINPLQDVSIDIEMITPRVKNIRDRIMNDVELGGVLLPRDVTYPLLHWSGKETICKYLGLPGLDFREHITITPFFPLKGIWSCFQAFETRTDDRGSELFVHYYVSDIYVLTAIV